MFEQAVPMMRNIDFSKESKDFLSRINDQSIQRYEKAK